MEVWMARQFGLRATSADAGAAAVASATQNLSESVSASNNLAQVGSPASKLSSQGADLPFSPASWRGGHGRRSISQD
jgi:hypothetical protein